MKKVLPALSILIVGYCAGLMSYSFWFAESSSQQLLGQSTSLEVDHHANASLVQSVQQSKASFNDEIVNPTSLQSNASSEEIKHALEELTTSIGIGKAYLLLNQASEQELLDLLEEHTAEKDKFGANTISLLLAVLTEKNLQAGVEYLEQNLLSVSESNLYISAVLKVWADKKPFDALNWYQQNKNNISNLDGFFKGVPLMDVFDGLAKQDFQMALSSLEQFASSDSEMQFSLIGVAENLENVEDFESLYRFAENLPNKLMRETVISKWTRKHPYKAAEWAAAMEGATQDTDYSENVFRAWAFSGNVNEAADWYIEQGTDEERQRRAKLIADDWGFRNPQAAMDWIGAQEDLDQNKTLKGLFDIVGHNSPEFVLNNIESLETEKQKVEALFSLYMSLKMTNKQRAQNMVADSYYRDALEARIREYEEQNRE